MTAPADTPVCGPCFRVRRSHGTRSVRGVVWGPQGTPVDVVRSVARWLCPSCGDVLVEARDDPGAVRRLVTDALAPPVAGEIAPDAPSRDRIRTVTRRWDEERTRALDVGRATTVVMAVCGAGTTTVVCDADAMTVSEVCRGPAAASEWVGRVDPFAVFHNGPSPFRTGEGPACVSSSATGRRDVALPPDVHARAARAFGEARCYATVLDALVRRTSFDTVRRGAFLALAEDGRPPDVLGALGVARTLLDGRRAHERATALRTRCRRCPSSGTGSGQGDGSSGPDTSQSYVPFGSSVA